MKPLIDYNGVVREMTEAEYQEYLKAQSEIPELPKTPEQRLDSLEPSVDEIYLVLADMLGGADNGI